MEGSYGRFRLLTLPYGFFRIPFGCECCRQRQTRPDGGIGSPPCRAIEDVVNAVNRCERGPGGRVTGLDIQSLWNHLWEDAIAMVRGNLVETYKIEIDSVDLMVRAVHGGLSEHECLSHWSFVKIESYFNSKFSDCREIRIRQLWEKVVVAIRHDRPKAKWSWEVGEPHREGSCGGGVLIRTYQRRHIKDFENLVRFVVHLATGDDPLMIEMPVIEGWNDGENTVAEGEGSESSKRPIPWLSSPSVPTWFFGRFSAHRTGALASSIALGRSLRKEARG